MNYIEDSIETSVRNFRLIKDTCLFGVCVDGDPMVHFLRDARNKNFGVFIENENLLFKLFNTIIKSGNILNTNFKTIVISDLWDKWNWFFNGKNIGFVYNGNEFLDACNNFVLDKDRYLVLIVDDPSIWDNRRFKELLDRGALGNVWVFVVNPVENMCKTLIREIDSETLKVGSYFFRPL